MRVHVIQHVPFEGPGLIAQWARERSHELTTALATTEEFPDATEIDFLVVMGGPMDADDEIASPWLHAEKHFIAEAIAGGRLVLGVCLGAQILAEVIGGTVRRNPQREIGWYPVHRTEAGSDEPLFADLPDPLVVGQWHSDTFDLPVGLDPLLSSEACVNQAFVFDHRAVGLQFHLEWTEDALSALFLACGSEQLGDDGQWVMSAAEMSDEAPERMAENREALFMLLDAMEAEGPGVPGDEAQ